MISFKEFDEIITYLKKSSETFNKVNDILGKLYTDNLSTNMFDYTGGHEMIIIDLLNKIFNLTTDNQIGTDLDYWIYELEYGKRWSEDFTIFNEDGSPIKLKTNKDIYNYLTKAV